MKYEYTTSYVPVSYQKQEFGFIFKIPAPSTVPTPESLHENPEYLDLMERMGNEGWELVSVQSLLRGNYNYGRGNQSAVGYAVTAGYYLFWKRPALEQ